MSKSVIVTLQVFNKTLFMVLCKPLQKNDGRVQAYLHFQVPICACRKVHNRELKEPQLLLQQTVRLQTTFLRNYLRRKTEKNKSLFTDLGQRFAIDFMPNS